jgi:hypothetical protein
METAHLVLSTGSAQTVLGAPKRNPGVTPQMLTLQLRQLEADEIVTRKIYAEVPARVEYQLTLTAKPCRLSSGICRSGGSNTLTVEPEQVVHSNYKSNQRGTESAFKMRSRNGRTIVVPNAKKPSVIRTSVSVLLTARLTASPDFNG